MHRAYDPPPHHHHDHGHGHHHRPRHWHVSRRALLTCLGLALLAYLATGITMVRTNERAVVQRCGKLLPGLVPPGLHVGLPWGIDRVTRLRMSELKRVAVGVGLADRALGRASDPRQAECLTGDRNLVAVSAVVQFSIIDGPSYLFHAVDVPKLVESSSAAALASVIASMKIDDVFTAQRIAVQNEVKQRAQASLNQFAAGVQIASVSLEGAAPPAEVADAFRDVTSAREDRQRTVNEAQGYANRLIPQARGEAERIVNEAQGYAAETTTKAQGDAERFTLVAVQAAKAPGLTAERLFLETLEEVLPKLRKVFVDGRAKQGLDLGLLEEEP